MRHIVDGHEYRTTEGDNFLHLLRNNYGTKVAYSEYSPCKEYIHFATIEDNDEDVVSDSYHINNMGDIYTIEQQLARWYSATD